MKTMKKLWTAICALMFTLAFGLGIALNVNATAKADTAQNVSITWAAIQYDNDEPTTPTKYAFVLQDGIETPEDYTFSVYFDGQAVPAYTIAGHNLIYVDYVNFPSDVNDVHLFKMPAGTYYQSGSYTSTDCTLLLQNAGWNNDLNRFDILTYDVVSEAAFDFGLYMADSTLGDSTNAQLYFATNDGGALTYNSNWSVSYNTLGNTVKVNGNYIERWITQFAEGQGYMPFDDGVITNAGDTLTIDGWFYNADQNKAFRVEESTFKFDGQAWCEVGTPEYDLVLSTTANGGDANGIYASMDANDIPVKDWEYQTKACGGKGILFNGEPLDTCLQKWSVGDWYVNLSAVGKSAVAGDVVTVFGWFYCNGDGTSQWHVKINPTTFIFDGSTWSQENVVISVNLNDTAVETQQLYVIPGETTAAITATASGSMLTDTTVTTVYENGAVVDGKFVLRDGESSSAYSVTFSVKDKNGVVYKKEMVVRVGFEDFVMENGASVRVLKNGENTEANGLRFIAELSKETYDNLKAQNATFGMIIVPRDYITEGYELTVNNLFSENAKWQAVSSSTELLNVASGKKGMLQIADLTAEDKDGDGRYELYGAIRNILVKNLTREFVGVAYVYVNGAYILASYYGNDMENNTRSIYYVSQKAIDANNYASEVQSGYIDKYSEYLTGLNASYNLTYTVNYIKTANGKTETETKEVSATLNQTVTLNAETFDGYTLTSAATLTSKLYANKPNVFNFYYKDSSAPSYDSVAWYYPALDSSNGYDNVTNDAIAQTMKDAGFTTVNLAGKNNIYITSEANITAMKQIVAMFYRNGLKSVVYTSNAAENEALGTEATTLPDFSDCEGFAGFLVWDEPSPTAAAMNRLAEYASWYNTVYGESEAPFMVNLFPSYASWFTGGATGDYTTYADYVKAYCDIVLSNVNGTKYLSMDSYPIMADGTLNQNFLYDLAVLKAYGMEYDAFVHACLQSSGWNEGNTAMEKAPTEEQMRLQLYTALAFGMDSVSWFTYTPLNDTITDQSPVDFAGNKNETVYEAMKAVNADLAAFGSLYKAYDWKGVIMSSPAKGTSLFGYYINQDAQYNAYNMVKSESLFTKYLLSASNTASFSEVSGSGNYIVGVMEDANGNEAFTVVNYSAIDDNKSVALTLTAAESASYTVYIDGVAQTVEIGTSGYTLNLQPGQGAFIVSANTQHTVTFENWDGTVLQSGKVAYGETPVYTGETPTRDGYEFVGWSPEISTVTKDVTYTAQFELIYTVTFVDYDGTVIETKKVTGGTTVEPVTATHETYIFKAWTLNGVEYDFNTAVTEDITLVATWQTLVESVKATEKIYTFTSTSDSNISTSARFESVADKADTWYQDDQGNPYGGYIQVTFDTADGEGYIVLPKINYALYSEVSFGVFGLGANNAVQLSINGNGGTLDNTGNIYYVVEIHGKDVEVHNMNGADTLFTATLTDAQYNGTEGLKLTVTESGWSCVQISHILGAQAYEIKDVGFSTVTFTNMVGEDIIQSVFAGDKATQPTDPTREGYLFAGWYTEEGEAFDFDASISEDTVIVAKWYVLTAITPTTETVLSGLMTSVTTTATYESGNGLVMNGAADNTYTFTLPTIEYFLYSEVSCITVFGQANTSYTFTAYGTTFTNVSVSWNWFKVVKVGAEGKTLGDGTVLAEGYYLTIGNTDVGSEWYTYVKLSDAVVNGEEGLTFSITTSEGAWDWMKFRQDGSVETDNFVGTKVYAMEEATACNLTETSTVDEYLAYMRKVNNFTAYEKANYEEPAIVATLRTQYAGTSATVVSSLMTNVTTTATYESGNGLVMNGAADNTYTFTLPTIEYFLYSEVSCITVFGQANTSYTFTAYGTTFTNVSVSWNWFKVVKVGAEGKTLGDGTVLAEGYYLTIGNTDVGSEWYTYVKLSDAVVNGEEGLTFSITTSEGAWDWMKFRQDGSVETDNFVGKLA